MKLIKPGLFSVEAHADTRRSEFDAKNEVIVMNRTSVEYVFAGDSITHAWELNAYFGGKGHIVLNRGIGGDRFPFFAKRFEADVLQLKPRYAVLLIGINNTWGMDPAGKNGTTPEEALKVWQEGMNQVLDAARAVGQSLVLGSLLPTDIPDNPLNEARNKLILEMNRRLKDSAEQDRHIYVDYHAAFADSDGKTLKAGLCHDGLHPNVGGYDVMAETLRSVLEKHQIVI